MSDTPTAVTVITTALASGSVAALVTHFFTSSRERRSLLRQKAEDLYVSVEAWENSWALTLISLKAAVDGSIDYNQHLETIIDQGKKVDGALNRRVHMLTEIYFPGAIKDLNGVLATLAEFNRISHLHKEAYRVGEFAAFEWQIDFAPRVSAVTQAFKSYRRRVVGCAQLSFSPLRLK